MPGTGYVVGDSSGWLRVKSEGSGTIVALPAYLKIEIGVIKNGREPFTVLEGVHSGKRFDAIPGNLKLGNPGYRSSAHLRFMSRPSVSQAFSLKATLNKAPEIDGRFAFDREVSQCGIWVLGLA